MDTANKKHYLSNNGGIDKLPDDILINILSRLDDIKEASRTSVLAPRWRYIWRFSHGILRFDNRDSTATGWDEFRRDEFRAFVNTVVELHQGPKVEGVCISFDTGRDMDLIKSNTFRGADSWYWVHYRWSPTFEEWVFFASRKQVQSLELNFSLHDGYKFLVLKSCMSISHGPTSPFCCLITLTLGYVDIEDEVIQYFLVWCPDLEELRVRFSYATKNLRVIDPPSLRVLEVSRCFNMQSLEISAADLISLLNIIGI